MSFGAGPHVLPFTLGDVAPESLDDDIDQVLRTAGNLIGKSWRIRAKKSSRCILTGTFVGSHPSK
jgi:hypothetical protein